MFKRLPRWLRWGFLVVLLAGLLPLAAIGALCLLLSAAEPGSFAVLLPNDCPGASVIIRGEVKDENYQPIDDANVIVRQSTVYHENPFTLRWATNSFGHFEVDEPVSIFVCDDLVFTVSAAGYETIDISYSLADNYSEWPSQNPIPISINPILSRKLDTDGVQSE